MINSIQNEYVKYKEYSFCFWNNVKLNCLDNMHYLSGLSEAHTESMSPTSSVP